MGALLAELGSPRVTRQRDTAPNTAPELAASVS